MTAAPTLSKVWSLYHTLRKDGAFSGQLVPQDRADKPAAAVLERIRVERENEAPSEGATTSTAREKAA
jgi:hypothetical protein